MDASFDSAMIDQLHCSKRIEYSVTACSWSDCHATVLNFYKNSSKIIISLDGNREAALGFEKMREIKHRSIDLETATCKLVEKDNVLQSMELKLKSLESINKKYEKEKNQLQTALLVLGEEKQNTANEISKMTVKIMDVLNSELNQNITIKTDIEDCMYSLFNSFMEFYDNVQNERHAKQCELTFY